MNVITYLARSLLKKRTVDEVLRNQRFLCKDVGKTQVALRCDKKVAPFHKPILACDLQFCLKELWYVNVAPQDVRNGLASLRASSRSNSPEMKQLMEYMSRQHDDLLKSMTDERKEIFEKFDDCWGEYTSNAEVAIFEYVFKLGMKIAIETLNDDKVGWV